MICLGLNLILFEIIVWDMSSNFIKVVNIEISKGFKGKIYE